MLCDTCSIQASRVRVNFWASEPGPTTSPKTPYTLVSDGYIFTSPSVYVIYSELYAQAECTLYGAGQIGNNISETTVAYPPDALSTARCYQPGDGGFNGWKTIDYEDWQNPPPNSVAATHSGCRLLGTATMFDPAGTDLVASPQFSLPQDLSTLQPVWGEFGCKPWRYGAFDPPRTLTRADAMVPDPQSSTARASSATLAAQVLPPIVTPTAAGAVQSTPAAASQDPKDPGKPLESEPGSGSQTLVPKPAPTSRASNAASEDPPPATPDPKVIPTDPPADVKATNDLQPPPTPTKQEQNAGPAPSQTAEEHPSSMQQAPPSSVLTVGSATYQYHVDPAADLVIASQTAHAGGPAISISGVQIGLASSANNLVVDGSDIPIQGPAATGAPSFMFENEMVTENSAFEYVIHGQTLTPGASAVTVSGTPISLGPSAAHVMIGSSTVPLAGPPAATPPAFTIGDKIITADKFSHFAIGDQTLIPGAPAITISGTPISLAPDATQAVVGGSTIAIQQAYPPTLPTYIINGQVITANSASHFILEGQTISPGGPAINISGTPISIPPASQSLLTIGSQTYPYTLDASSNILIASQTLSPGGAPVTVSGMTVSEDSVVSEIVVVSGGSPMTEGLGGIIAGAMGRTAVPSGGGGGGGGGRGNATGMGATFMGGASGRVGARGIVWVGCWVVVGVTLVVWVR